MKVEVRPTRGQTGRLAVVADEKTVAWVSPPNGAVSWAVRYRAELDGAEPDARIVKAVEQAQTKVRAATGKAHGAKKGGKKK